MRAEFAVRDGDHRPPVGGDQRGQRTRRQDPPETAGGIGFDRDVDRNAAGFRQIVRVVDGLIGFDADMVIAELAYVMDDRGLRTEIKVGPPDGYRSKAGTLKPEKRQKGGGYDKSDVGWRGVR